MKGVTDWGTVLSACVCVHAPLLNRWFVYRFSLLFYSSCSICRGCGSCSSKDKLVCGTNPCNKHNKNAHVHIVKSVFCPPKQNVSSLFWISSKSKDTVLQTWKWQEPVSSVGCSQNPLLTVYALTLLVFPTLLLHAGGSLSHKLCHHGDELTAGIVGLPLLLF